MAWIKVPPEHHPLFRAALPKDPRVETQLMFGGIAAKVRGHIFAGLFGRSTMLMLDETDRREALALDGAAPFEPMGDGRRMSDKVMLPEDTMHDPDELKSWIARAFGSALALPPKPAKKKPAKKKPAPKKPALKKAATGSRSRSSAGKRRRK